MHNFKALQIGMHWFPERPGGLDRVYYSLAQSLPAEGVHLRGLVVGDGGAERDTDGRITSFAKQSDSVIKRMLASRSSIRRELKNFQPDVVAIHFALYAAAGMRSLRHTPSVMHFHGPWAFESGVESKATAAVKMKAAIEKMVYSRTQRHIVLSEAFATVLAEKYGILRDTIDIVPGSVDASAFDVKVTRDDARRRLNLPTDRPVVVAVRRLVRRMGLEDLIDAVAALKSKWPDLLVVIGGRGRLHDELVDRARAAGVANNIRLFGFVSDEDLPFLYRAADFSIVPTAAFEGFGLITLESLASGTPVLVTPVGGLPEAVRGLSKSLILESTGAIAIADGLDGALSGGIVLPDQNACQAYAKLNFDLPVIARRTAAVYQKVIS